MIARQLARMPVIPVPAGWRFQPIDTGEVADQLVELALDAPAGLGGPRVYAMSALLRGYLQATGRHRPILPVRLPGNAARAFRAGANLAPDRPLATGRGRTSWLRG